MSLKSILSTAALPALLAASVCGWSASAAAQAKKVSLLWGYQDAAMPALVEASKVLEGTPYDFQWVVLAGPAAQLSALYSKAIDVGHMGDTSLIIEQSRAKTEWTEENAPLQIIAGWRNLDAKYPPIITVARTSSGVTTLADLKGKKWGNNFGGFNYLQYVLSYLKGGLTPKDFEGIQFGDAQASSAAFISGRVDAYSGGTVTVAEAIQKGDAKVIVTSDDLDIPALGVFTARGDVIRDPAKSEAVRDLLSRLQKYWVWYAANLDKVEQIYIERIKQTPSRAKLSTEFGKASFRPLDDDLVRREQRIADVLLEAGAIPRKIDVNVEFSRKYNSVTVPSAIN